MNRITAINGNVFITSDWHLNHDRKFIVQKRNFAQNINDYNNWIINKTNQSVKEKDKLVILGDFALNSSPQQVQEFMNAIRCKNVYYIWGNHEKPFYNMYQGWVKESLNISADVYPFTYSNFTFMGNQVDIRINNDPVTLSHFAMGKWNKSHYGAYCLSGHSHGDCPDTNEHGNSRQLDCGIDVCFRINGTPIINWEEVKTLKESCFDSTKHN
jgi:calcineurin-like phosphoesterase family protein